jgi:cytochrome c biogenesis protein
MDTSLQQATSTSQGQGRDSRPSLGKRLWRALGSLKLATILILALILASILGTLFPQLPAGADLQTQARWLSAAYEKYGPLARLYHRLGLFDVFHTPWFLLLLVALTLNTLVCTLNRTRAIWRTVTRAKVRAPDLLFERVPDRAAWTAASSQEAVEGLRGALARRRYRVLTQTADGTTCLYADKNRLARFGTLITHLSLILILGAAVGGKALSWREDEMVLPPGQVQEIGHGLPFQVRCEGFEMDRYPSGMAKDYRARLAVLAGGGEVLRETVRLNHPLDYGGVSFYLTSYGPAARVRVADASGQPLPLQTSTSEGAVLGLSSRLGRVAEGVSKPRRIETEEAVLTFAAQGDEEALLVPSRELTLRVSYQPRAALGQGEPSFYAEGYEGDEARPIFAGFVPQDGTWNWEDLRFEFTPDHYTVFLAVHDPSFVPVVAAGFLLLIGLSLSFYFPHKRLWAIASGEGEVRLAGMAERHKESFSREFAALVEGLGIRDKG